MRKLIYILLLFPLIAASQIGQDLDGIQNGDETGIDCGGSTGVPCYNGGALFAFPYGAEGAGKYTRGSAYGTSPTVYVVTNSNKIGAGSFMNAFGWDGVSGTASASNITIVFQVGVTVNLETQSVAISGSHVTILGQTAPANSGGVYITNGSLDWRVDELILQNIHFESGDWGYKDSNGNVINPGVADSNQQDAISVFLGDNVIVDHCSAKFGVDEGMTASNSTNVTFSHNIVALSLHDSNHGDGGSHSMGGILDRSDDGSPSGGRYSLIKCYVAHCDSRNYRSAKSIYEMVNNVFYGFRGQCTFSSGQTFSLIGNHWQKRTGQEVYNGQTIAQSSDATHGFGGAVYFEDNTRNHSVNSFYDTDYTNQGIIVGTAAESFTSNPTIWSSTVVVDSVLKNVGPRIHLGSIEQQVIDDFAADSGQIIDTQEQVGGFTTSAVGTAWTDSDGDGLDDSWENTTYGNLSQSFYGDQDNDGYLNFEEWGADLMGISSSGAGYSASAISGNTTESGGQATFTVVLNSQPTTDVVITVTSNNVFEGNANPTSLTFTNANWDTAQTVTVSGVDDVDEVDGNISYGIVLSVDDANSDNAFDSLPDITVSVINEDNDVVSQGKVIKARGGRLGKYRIKIN
ncbi:hypothetical protein [Flagellimonas sp. CMM7]|uniref:hypothetical protein n=1 Tax=Flagellimonas sp. CMM7 TaxID=2654676 RepID=UPI0013CF450F|nr:hypothetical protein [Flagellimonas sp. CMM7]UII79993.1 hypothetical protein LV704_00380 [Flagellimonas sp. CMM7]